MPYDMDSPVHLMRVRGLSARHNAGCCGARLASLVRGPLRLAWVSNFMVDMTWLMSCCPDLARAQQASAAGAGHLQMHRPPLPIAYGTHHSKAFLLTTPTGLRLIICTANAIYSDCNNKSQGLWVQDFPPKQPPGGPPSAFERDLVAYMRALGMPQPMAGPLLDAIAAHDFSHARGSLVASVPGYHRGPQLSAFGHMRLRRLLEAVQLPPGFGAIADGGAGAAGAAGGGGGGGGGAAEQEGLVIQCSSMGSFDQAWLIDQFGASLAAHRRPPLQPGAGAGLMGGLPRPSGPHGSRPLPLAVVWPTVEEVRNSLEGWSAGRSIPGPAKNVAKPFMRRYFAPWGGETVGRQRAMPHIKTYTRYRGQQLAWFLVTSHNLSKAAWGELQKNGTQLMIRSYEMGVLVTPAHEAAYRSSPHWGFCCTDGGTAAAVVNGGASAQQQQQQPTSTALPALAAAAGCPPPAVKFLTLAAATAAAAGRQSTNGTGGGASGAAEVVCGIPVPFVLPPVPYRQEDRPWTVDEPRAEVDALGLAWGTPQSHYGHTEPPEG
ncbi:hypothetical protein GPECTOR_3g86 [Gonium pectorale]|uniref:Tyrosyl-DNA phosphodiesterase n=1 Tax=Gonium pectorale TaxID=33097 RepID=A0A150GZU4_GONPE|nr:hypothetical protein GPECTOR_3g86 [Gonium pectorale]|eukprot:KXZ55436.1 hypothetical protein GPECTOR_3g86 [Gonium pectorale]